MGSYSDFYEQIFGKYNEGDSIRIAKDGCVYSGILLYKNDHFITLQLGHYREGFSVPDFFEGHSRILGEGENIEVNNIASEDDADIDFADESEEENKE